MSSILGVDDLLELVKKSKLELNTTLKPRFIVEFKLTLR